MLRRFDSLVRKAAPWLAAGMLLQQGGCAFDFSSLAAGLTTSVATNLISSIVFGAFNLTP